MKKSELTYLIKEELKLIEANTKRQMTIDYVRKNAPGYVGTKFAKKASDEDILSMVDLKDEHAEIYNSKMKPIQDKIDALNKKYGIKA